jgi:hypothetical protein
MYIIGIAEENIWTYNKGQNKEQAKLQNKQLYNCSAHLTALR